MRESFPLVSLVAGGLTAFCLVATVFLSPGDALAADPSTPATGLSGEEAAAPPCSCPGTSSRRQKPKYADLKTAPDDGRPLDAGDEMAALSSVQHALSATADGATYIWHRNNGRLSGLVKPTSSFKNVNGSICRHVVVMMTTGNKTRKAEGVACRDANGVWTLEG
jgi:surface antigen